jgi:predicted DNA-binding transcriptional regulator AlpA
MKPIPERTTPVTRSFTTIRKIGKNVACVTSTPFQTPRRMKMETDRLLPLSRVAEIYGGISVKTVRRKIAAREFPQPTYVGRTPMLFQSEVHAAIERLKKERDERGVKQ